MTHAEIHRIEHAKTYMSGGFGYDDRQRRNIAVDARAIAEALRSICGADNVLRELGGR